MRIRVRFGQDNQEETDWHKNLDDFPKLLIYKNKKYDWVFYDKDETSKVDIILLFTEVPNYDPNFYVDCSSWENLFSGSQPGCECGARFSSFDFDHMRMCKLWKPW